MINIIRLLIIVCTASTSFAATGSNLGQYATNFSPAVLTGQVTDRTGSPVSGATVSTIAGHSTTTDVTGNYTLPIDAPGIYTVMAASGAETATNTVEVSLGTTTALNIMLAAAIPTLPQWGMLLLTLALLTLATWHLAGQSVLVGSSVAGLAVLIPARPHWLPSLLLGQVVAASGLLIYAFTGKPLLSHDGLGTFLAGLLIGVMIETVRRNQELI